MGTPFDIFGLPVSCDLDVKALEARHRELSLEFHPDRFATADAKTRVRALEKTTALNDAFKVLKDPFRRALAVLKTHGVDLENEQAAAKVQLPLEFLEEVMTRREQLEGLRVRKNLEAAQQVGAEMTALRQQILAEGTAALAANDIALATQKLGRVRYYTRFIEEVEAFEEEELS